MTLRKFQYFVLLLGLCILVLIICILNSRVNQYDNTFMNFGGLFNRRSGTFINDQFNTEKVKDKYVSLQKQLLQKGQSHFPKNDEVAGVEGNDAINVRTNNDDKNENGNDKIEVDEKEEEEVDDEEEGKDKENYDLKEDKSILFQTNGEKQTRNDSCKNCFPHNFKYLINPEKLCTSRKVIDLIIIITTIHTHRGRRDAIRQTWAVSPHANWTIFHVFLFGLAADPSLEKALVKESEQYGDVLQENFVDSYRNLTVKTIMGFKWVAKYCSNARFVLKTDDDMMINPSKVVSMASNPRYKTTITGACTSTKLVLRNPQQKFYINPQEYAAIYYPPTCGGSGYTVPMSEAVKIAKVSANIPFFPWEDVYIGMCAHHLGIQTKRIYGYYIRCNFIKNETLCEKQCVDKMITQHVYGDSLIKIWNVCGEFF